MKAFTITEVDLSTVVGSAYTVNVAWRYGTSGSFTVVTSTADVNSSGTLLDTVSITYDETINSSIQIRVTYNGCSSTPYYEIISL